MTAFVEPDEFLAVVEAALSRTSHITNPMKQRFAFMVYLMDVSLLQRYLIDALVKIETADKNANPLEIRNFNRSVDPEILCQLKRRLEQFPILIQTFNVINNPINQYFADLINVYYEKHNLSDSTKSYRLNNYPHSAIRSFRDTAPNWFLINELLPQMIMGHKTSPERLTNPEFYEAGLRTAFSHNAFALSGSRKKCPIGVKMAAILSLKPERAADGTIKIGQARERGALPAFIYRDLDALSKGEPLPITASSPPPDPVCALPLPA
jgi:hypothetical protein